MILTQYLIDFWKEGKFKVSSFIKDELDKRIRKLEEGLERCAGLVDEVEGIKEREIKENMRKYLKGQLEDVEKKIEKMRKIWDERKG